MDGPSSGIRDGTVAVLDFATDTDGTDGVDTWAVGLTEFMTMALQQRGFVTLERRDLRFVVAERRLSYAGILSCGDIVARKLPWVKYLLKGVIHKDGESGFQLDVSLFSIDVTRNCNRDWHVTQEWSAFECDAQYLRTRAACRIHSN